MSSFGNGEILVMSTNSNSAFNKSQKETFWKVNMKSVPGSIKPVYGAQHPPRKDKPAVAGAGNPSTSSGGSANGMARAEPQKGARSKDSFQHFQDYTSDAWDDGDDDLITTANIRMSIRDVKHTALQVINNHSQQQQDGSGSSAQSETSDGANSASAPTTPGYEKTTSSNFSIMDSAPNTPRHGAASHPRVNGPGVGIRLQGQRSSRSTPNSLEKATGLDSSSSKNDKFQSLLEQPNISLDELKKVSWSGIPKKYRPSAWKILSGYIPPSLDRRKPTLERKRQEYYNFVGQYYETRHQEHHIETYRQICVDIPRMRPLINIFGQTAIQKIGKDVPRMGPAIPILHQEVVQRLFERILFIWAIRHPASGYVQGINDLVTPYFVVFLSEYISNDVEVENCDLGDLPVDQLQALEADCFWCFSKLLDGIQDNYTFAQPGIQVKINALKDLTSRIDNNLHQHLLHHNVEYLQFTFRWMNNLLMREFPLRCVIRLWDTYLSEQDGFASFHLYMCAAFLARFSEDLQREKDFHGLMLMLQNLPTHHWGHEEIGLLLAEAYKLKYMFADAPKHLSQKT